MSERSAPPLRPRDRPPRGALSATLRHLLPISLTVLVLVAALAVLGVAWLRVTSWRPAATISGSWSGQASGGLVSVPPALVAQGRQVSVSASGPGAVTVTVARQADSTAYLEQHLVSEVSMVSGGALSLRPVGTGTETLLPQAADIWAAMSAGSGTAELVWPQTPGSWQILIFGADSVHLTWSRSDEVSGQPALIVLGLFLLGAGITGLFAVLRSRVGPAGAASEDDRDADPDAEDPDAGRAATDGVIRIAAPLAALLAAIPGLGLLSGCSAGGSNTLTASGVVSAPATVAPVVFPVQGQTICDAVDAAWTAAAATTAKSLTARGPVVLGPRLTGPARATLAAAILVHGKVPQIAVPVGTFSRTRILVTSASGWPRWIAEVGTDSVYRTPVVRILVSRTAREPYALWGVAQLLPGAALPELAPVTRGALALAPDQTGLVAAPSAVLSGYADLLSVGNSAGSAALYRQDIYRQQLGQRLATDKAAFLKTGSVTTRHEPATDLGPVLSVRTATGGALVIGVLRQSYTVTIAKASSAVALDPSAAALAGQATFGHQAVRTSLEVLAFTVPTSGGNATGSIQLVAAGKMDVSVRGR